MIVAGCLLINFRVCIYIIVLLIPGDLITKNLFKILCHITLTDSNFGYLLGKYKNLDREF